MTGGDVSTDPSAKLTIAKHQYSIRHYYSVAQKEHK